MLNLDIIEKLKVNKCSMNAFGRRFKSLHSPLFTIILVQSIWIVAFRWSFFLETVVCYNWFWVWIRSMVLVNCRLLNNVKENPLNISFANIDIYIIIIRNELKNTLTHNFVSINVLSPSSIDSFNNIEYRYALNFSSH